jgi:hypothetical protein
VAALPPLPAINGDRDAAAVGARLRELEEASAAAGGPSERLPLTSEIVRLRAALAAYRLRSPESSGSGRPDAEI